MKFLPKSSHQAYERRWTKTNGVPIVAPGDPAGRLPRDPTSQPVSATGVFRIAPEAISETHATMTRFEGRIVYQSDAP